MTSTMIHMFLFGLVYHLVLHRIILPVDSVSSFSKTSAIGIWIRRYWGHYHDLGIMLALTIKKRAEHTQCIYIYIYFLYIISYIMWCPVMANKTVISNNVHYPIAYTRPKVVLKWRLIFIYWILLKWTMVYINETYRYIIQTIENITYWYIYIYQNPWPGVLTHWPRDDVAEVFSNSLHVYRIVGGALAVNLLSGECHRTYFTNEKSKLVQAVGRWRQATNH